MALTYSPKSQGDLKVPEFSLKDVFGKTVDLRELSSKKVFCLMFICNHCPYVKAIEDRLIALAQNFSNESEIQFAAVCSNDPSDYEEDSIENLKARAVEKKYPFPYLVDESQELARMLGAVCTPDLYVFDRQGSVFYRGRLDDSWRDPAKVESEDLKEALLAALTGKDAPVEQIPSMGCSIKWKVDPS